MKKTMSAVAVLVALLTMSLGFPAGGYKIGDYVKDFELKNVDGKKVSMGMNKEVKGYIITFTCNTCPVAKAYEDRIIDLHKKFESKGFPVIAIQANDGERSPGDSYTAMQQRAKAKNYGFPYLIDESQEIVKAFGATNTPHTFLVKKESNGFKLVYAGAIDNNSQDGAAATKKYIETAIEEVIANKEVSTPSVRAVGCGIKWKSV